MVIIYTVSIRLNPLCMADWRRNNHLLRFSHQQLLSTPSRYCQSTRTQYERDEFTTSNATVVELRQCAALQSLLASRDLLELVIEQEDDEIVFPPETNALDALFS